jgi:hypothetical protein
MEVLEFLVMLLPCAVLLWAAHLVPAIKCPHCERASWAFKGDKKECLHCGRSFV